MHGFLPIVEFLQEAILRIPHRTDLGPVHLRARSFLAWVEERSVHIDIALPFNADLIEVTFGPMTT